MSKKIIITATVFDPNDESESNGWVDLNWNRFELRENSEDVSTHELPEDETIEEFVQSLIGSVEPLSIRNGVYYAEDTVFSPEGEYWNYAACVVNF